MAAKDRPDNWWGQFSLAEGQTARWHISALRLAIQRLAYEWKIAYEYDHTVDWSDATWSYSPDAPDIEDIEYKNRERHAFEQTQETLYLTPILPDRPLVIRPITPLYVPAGESTNIFASSPLWVRIEVGQPPHIIREIPIRRPSDTWFGPSTMEGELCYADKTTGRLRVEYVPTRVHRAITKVMIRNQASLPLQVERLSLPVIYLSLFCTPDGLLWTQMVTMDRTRNTGMAALNVTNQLPIAAKEARLVSGPRQMSGQNMVVRAFEALFG
jgi:hypothetical protein